MNETFSNLFKGAIEATQSHFNNAVAAVRNRYWIVGSIDENGNFSFSSKPATHPSESSAMSEAGRLAKANPGKAYIAVRFVGGVLVPRVVGSFEF